MADKDFKGFKKDSDTYNCYDTTARSGVNSLTPRVGIVEGKVSTLEGQMLSVEDDLDNLGTASTKNSTSVVTESSDLVESGAVYDAIGWGNKNELDYKTDIRNYYTSVNEIANGLHLISSSAKSWCNAYYIVPNVDKNTQKTLSCDVDFVSGNFRITIRGNNDGSSSGDVLSNSEVVTSDKKVAVTFNTGNYNYLVFGFYITLDIETIGEANITNIQLEKGTTATAYEPYHASVSDSLDDKMSYSYNAKTGVHQLLPLKFNYFKLRNTDGVWTNTTYVTNGVTYTLTVDADENVTEIDANGTATADAYLHIFNRLLTPYAIKKGLYKLSGCPSGGGLNTYRLACIQTVGGSAQGAYDIGDGVDVKCTADTNAGFNICVLNGKSISHGKFYPLFKYAEDSATVLTPFAKTNIQLTQDKADNSVIGTVEGANASKAWSVGEHFIKDGAFKEVTQAISSGGAISDSNTVNKPIADLLTPKRLTSSDDLNNIKQTGTYVWDDPAPSNAPSSQTSYANMDVTAVNTDVIRQVIYHTNTGIYMRRYAYGSWSAWSIFTGTPI